MRRPSLVRGARIQGAPKRRARLSVPVAVARVFVNASGLGGRQPRGTATALPAVVSRDTKLVIAQRVGKRVPALAYSLIHDLRRRMVGEPTIITDGWVALFEAVNAICGGYGCKFGQLVKSVSENRHPVREGYAPAKVVSCRKYPVFGDLEPSEISTSLIERQNWSLRTAMRRMTRMSNGFSRKLENLKAAVALHYAAYNFFRVHRTLGVTPAMAAGLATMP